MKEGKTNQICARRESEGCSSVLHMFAMESPWSGLYGRLCGGGSGSRRAMDAGRPAAAWHGSLSPCCPDSRRDLSPRPTPPRVSNRVDCIHPRLRSPTPHSPTLTRYQNHAHPPEIDTLWAREINRWTGQLLTFQIRLCRWHCNLPPRIDL